MKTLNQIKSKLNELASQHLQINSFRFYGDPPERFDLQGEKFVFMGVILQPGNLLNKVNSKKMVLFFADLVDTDNANLDEVLSDTELIALDIFAQFWKWSDENGIELLRESPFKSFAEDSEHAFAGWQIDITINQFYSKDTCQVPGVSTYLLNETGGYLLLENGGKILI